VDRRRADLEALKGDRSAVALGGVNHHTWSAKYAASVGNVKVPWARLDSRIGTTRWERALRAIANPVQPASSLGLRATRFAVADPAMGCWMLFVRSRSVLWPQRAASTELNSNLWAGP